MVEYKDKYDKMSIERINICFSELILGNMDLERGRVLMENTLRKRLNGFNLGNQIITRTATLCSRVLASISGLIIKYF